MEHQFTVSQMLAIFSGLPHDAKVYMASHPSGHDFRPFAEAEITKFYFDDDSRVEDVVVLYPRFES